MTLSLGNASVQLRLASAAVAPVALTFVGPMLLRTAEVQARPHRLQIEDLALFRVLQGQGLSFRSLILTGGTLCVLPIGQENTGKRPIVLLDGYLKERQVQEGVPIVLDGGALRVIGQDETLVT